MGKSGCVAVLGWACAVSTAQAAGLMDAVEAARQHDAALAAARHVLHAGQERRVQGIAGLLPRAQLEGSDQRHRNHVAGAGDLPHRRQKNLTATLTQPLFDVSRVAGLQRGNAESRHAELSYARSMQDLSLRVAHAYFEVLYQREVLQAAAAARAAYERQLGHAEAALKHGEGTRTEVDEAQANHDQALARELQAQTALDVAGGTFTRLTGLPAQEIATLAWTCVAPHAPVALPAAMDDAARDNLDVRVAGESLDVARAEVTDALGAALPVVNLVASHGSERTRTEGYWGDAAYHRSRSTAVGVTLTMPLFAGGGNVSRTREALSRRDAARDTVEDARRQARQKARAAWLGVTQGTTIVQAQQRAVDSAAGKVASTRMGRKVGLRTSLDELNAQQRHFEARRDLAGARHDWLRARLDLAAARGALDDAELAAIGCRT